MGQIEKPKETTAAIQEILKSFPDGFDPSSMDGKPVPDAAPSGQTSGEGSERKDYSNLGDGFSDDS